MTNSLLLFTLKYKDFIQKTVDNYVSIVYKGHNLKLSFKYNLIKNMLKNKDIILKDTKIILFVSRETNLSCYMCNIQ